MQLNIRGHKPLLDPEARTHCERRLLLALSRFSDRLARVTLRLSALEERGGMGRRCELAVQVRGGRELVIAVEDVQLQAAVERAVDRASHAVARELERSARP